MLLIVLLTWLSLNLVAVVLCMGARRGEREVAIARSAVRPFAVDARRPRAS